MVYFLPIFLLFYVSFFKKYISANKKKILLLIILIFICGLSPIVVHKFQFSIIYANPFFRLLEFCSGMILADLFIKMKKRPSRLLVIFLLLEFCGFIIAITYLHYFKLGDYKIYVFIAMPVFLIIIYQLARLNSSKFAQQILTNSLIQYLSKISYAFFLGQFFTWDLTNFLQSNTSWFENATNIKLILVSLTICMIITILMHELIEKPVLKILKTIS
ncbi:MAG: acyltransferase family protein [Lachnospiraceae bacterium]